MVQKVIVVDENNKKVCLKEKNAVHIDGDLHRAFSIFIFNKRGELLLQQRSLEKYHSAGLWTNSCCSHPLLSEEGSEEAESRLRDEMGFSCVLKKVTRIKYNLHLQCGMIEHESNDIYQGVYDGEVVINPEEACDYKWVSFSEILDELTQNPQAYTEWFKYLLLEAPLGSELSVSITAQSVQRDG